MRSFLSLLILLCAAANYAQSGHSAAEASPGPAASPEVTVRQMFDEVNGYAKAKFTEFEQKKIPYTDELLERTKREQRQLAAKYAASAGARTTLGGDDLYYLGMLHWISENLDGAAESLARFVGQLEAPPERRQSARAILAVVYAKQRKLDAAEAAFADYGKAQPIKVNEQARIAGEIAKAYQAERNFARMAPHAETAYLSSKAMIKTAASRAAGLDEVLDAGMLLFEAYRDSDDRKKAEATLDDMRNTAGSLEAPSFYYYAADQKIKYLIETGQKPRALALYQALLLNVAKEFALRTSQEDVQRRLKKREYHYKLLGEPAPALGVVDQWFPGRPATIESMRGRVVLLDFWATWCGPCFDAFPHLKEWHELYQPKGLEILGITRYYGMIGATTADRPAELEYLRGFTRTHKMPYDTVVGRDQSIQMLYGATTLPTTVLIDRKGIVRYVEAGTSTTRIAEIESMIAKLIAEK